MQSIFPYREIFDQVRLFRRGPFFYHLSVLIKDLQMSTFDFLFSGNVCLTDLHLRMVILHGNLLDLSRFLYRKGYILCPDITVFCRCRFFMEGIISRRQGIDHMRLGSRYPFFHHFSVFINYLKRSAFYFFLPGNVRLCDFRHGRLILHFLSDLDYFQSRVCIGSIYFDGFRIWQVSRQMFDLLDLIFPVGKV